MRTRRVLTVRGSGGDRCALSTWYDGNPMPGFDVDMLGHQPLRQYRCDAGPPDSLDMLAKIAGVR